MYSTIPSESVSIMPSFLTTILAGVAVALIEAAIIHLVKNAFTGRAA